MFRLRLGSVWAHFRVMSFLAHSVHNSANNTDHTQQPSNTTIALHFSNLFEPESMQESKMDVMMPLATESPSLETPMIAELNFAHMDVRVCSALYDEAVTRWKETSAEEKAARKAWCELVESRRAAVWDPVSADFQALTARCLEAFARCTELEEKRAEEFAIVNESYYMMRHKKTVCNEVMKRWGVFEEYWENFCRRGAALHKARVQRESARAQLELEARLRSLLLTRKSYSKIKAMDERARAPVVAAAQAEEAKCNEMYEQVWNIRKGILQSDAALCSSEQIGELTENLEDRARLHNASRERVLAAMEPSIQVRNMKRAVESAEMAVTECRKRVKRS